MLDQILKNYLGFFLRSSKMIFKEFLYCLKLIQ